LLLLDRGVSAGRDRLVREYATWMSSLNTRAEPPITEQALGTTANVPDARACSGEALKPWSRETATG